MNAKADLMQCSEEMRDVISQINIRNQIEKRNVGLD